MAAAVVNRLRQAGSELLRCTLRMVRSPAPRICAKPALWQHRFHPPIFRSAFQKTLNPRRWLLGFGVGIVMPFVSDAEEEVQDDKKRLDYLLHSDANPGPFHLIAALQQAGLIRDVVPVQDVGASCKHADPRHVETEDSCPLGAAPVDTDDFDERDLIGPFSAEGGVIRPEAAVSSETNCEDEQNDLGRDNSNAIVGSQQQLNILANGDHVPLDDGWNNSLANLPSDLVLLDNDKVELLIQLAEILARGEERGLVLLGFTSADVKLRQVPGLPPWGVQFEVWLSNFCALRYGETIDGELTPLHGDLQLPPEIRHRSADGQPITVEELATVPGWLLGGLAYQLFGAENPVANGTFSQVPPPLPQQVPAPVATLIHSMVSLDTDQRPATCRLCCDLLQLCLLAPAAAIGPTRSPDTVIQMIGRQRCLNPGGENGDLLLNHRERLCDERLTMGLLCEYLKLLLMTENIG